MVKIAVPRETAAGESRVALVPESVARLVRAGAEVRIERGAGAGARLSDEAFQAAGAILQDSAAAAFEGATVIARVRRPSAEEAAEIPDGTVLIALLQPSADDALLRSLGERGVTCLSLERVPRITRAQSMDVLSSVAADTTSLATKLAPRLFTCSAAAARMSKAETTAPRRRAVAIA